jgi:hypothetical protein
MPTINVPGFEFQKKPRIYHALIPGRWLLERTTPSWRIKDPVQGFQRLIREERARQIAVAVLDQGRSFPNSIVLARNGSKYVPEISPICGRICFRRNLFPPGHFNKGLSLVFVLIDIGAVEFIATIIMRWGLVNK